MNNGILMIFDVSLMYHCAPTNPKATTGPPPWSSAVPAVGSTAGGACGAFLFRGAPWMPQLNF